MDSQLFRRFPDVAGSSVMTVKSGALRVSGLAARSVITMMVPRVQCVRDAPDARPVQVFSPSQDRAGPEVDGNAVLGVATQSERRHL